MTEFKGNINKSNPVTEVDKPLTSKEERLTSYAYNCLTLLWLNKRHTLRFDFWHQKYSVFHRLEKILSDRLKPHHLRSTVKF